MMIPITRKEKYINEIVGGGNTAPETPQTREEIFYAAILGEVVAPSPITRAEKYLAKIANKYSGELPEPVTRIERFLARAAGMDVTIPTPITREEMFWADALIVEKELSGIPPLTFNAIAGTLKNYRIYGNTVNGESVGDRTGNLFDGEWTQGGVGNTGNLNDENQKRIKTIVSVIPSQTYTIRTNLSIRMIFAYNDTTEESGIVSKLLDIMNGVEFATITIPNNANLIAVSLMSSDNSNITPSDVEWTMLNSGSTALPYEPYSYKIPVILTADSTETTDIYLDEPLAKSGNNADYIDYATQKRHNSDGTESSITLPEIAVTAGTNTLSVGTEVQPSDVYIKYEGAR